jgi:hypothetical protein
MTKPRSFRSFAVASLAWMIAVAACGGPPKQAEVPDVTDDKGADMAAEPAGGDTGKGEQEVKASKEEMHAKCCEQCKEGLSKDRSGGDAATIPCADYTDTLKPWCLEHFRANPTMANACK